MPFFSSSVFGGWSWGQRICKYITPLKFNMDTWIPNQMFGKGTCLSNMAISGVQQKSIPYFAPHTLYQSFIAQFAMHSFWYEHTSHRVYSKWQCTCLKINIYIYAYANIYAHKHNIIISTIINVYNGFYLHINMIIQIYTHAYVTPRWSYPILTPLISFLFNATCHRAAASRPLPSATSDPLDKMPGAGGNCLKDPRVGSGIHGHNIQ